MELLHCICYQFCQFPSDNRFFVEVARLDASEAPHNVDARHLRHITERTTRVRQPAYRTQHSERLGEGKRADAVPGVALINGTAVGDGACGVVMWGRSDSVCSPLFFRTEAVATMACGNCLAISSRLRFHPGLSMPELLSVRKVLKHNTSSRFSLLAVCSSRAR